MNIIVIESEREPDHPSSSTIIVATQTITTEEVIASQGKKEGSSTLERAKVATSVVKMTTDAFGLVAGTKKTGNETCSYWVHQSYVGLF